MDSVVGMNAGPPADPDYLNTLSVAQPRAVCAWPTVFRSPPPRTSWPHPAGSEPLGHRGGAASRVALVHRVNRMGTRRIAEGNGVIQQSGREARLRPGDLTLVDMSQPAYWAMAPSRAIAIVFPRTLLPLRADEVARLTAVGVPGDQGRQPGSPRWRCRYPSISTTKLVALLALAPPASGSARPCSTFLPWRSPHDLTEVRPSRRTLASAPSCRASSHSSTSAWAMPTCRRLPSQRLTTFHCDTCTSFSRRRIRRSPFGSVVADSNAPDVTCEGRRCATGQSPRSGHGEASPVRPTSAEPSGMPSPPHPASAA
jgi:hypothetical protein